jgi:hypothetical protein
MVFLLPNPKLLRATLPTHWPSDILTSASCTSLEMIVDSAFLSRAQAVQDVQALMPHLTIESTLIHNALDIIQTRSCRVSLMDERGSPKNVRLLAPVFDLINHDASANAEFVLENNRFLVVRALVDLKADEQVCIDYGDSARPAYMCLSSYGFLPRFNDEGSEDHIAEVYLDGVRHEVGPTTIPKDMVASAIMTSDERNHLEEIILTPNIATSLSKRILQVAYNLLLHPLEGCGDNEKTDYGISANLAR